tara:strand:- start:454 stop:723 length:270 start_codon:yes stop_codon:yes gene_type:complete
LLGTAGSKDDKRVKEILNLTNGIRVDIEDMVKCGSLRYKTSPRLRSRILRSPVIPIRIPSVIRERSIMHDPYDAERYIPHDRRIIDHLR